MASYKHLEEKTRVSWGSELPGVRMVVELRIREAASELAALESSRCGERNVGEWQQGQSRYLN